MSYNWSNEEIHAKVKKILIFLEKRKFLSNEIKFSIINSKEKNAYATKLNQIVITDSLLNYLVKHIKDLIDFLKLKQRDIKKEENKKYAVIFDNLEINISKRRIFDMWFNFIFFHELSHILRRHFDILQQTKIAEFYLREKRTDRFFFEIDADRLASAMLAPFIANENDTNLFLESSGYLFHLLYMIENEDNNDFNDYPHPFIRFLFFYQNIYQFSQIYSKLNLKYEYNDIFKNIEKFIITNQNFYSKKIISDGFNIKQLKKQYSEFIKKNIKILKSEFTNKEEVK